MGGEPELSRRHTVWIRGKVTGKNVQGILTADHLLLFQRTFSGTHAHAPDVVSAVASSLILNRLRKRREEKAAAEGPILDIPLSSITGIARSERGMTKDRITISTADEEYLFSDGWKDWSPLLRVTLTQRHGRQVIEDGPDVWRIEPAQR